LEFLGDHYELKMADKTVYSFDLEGRLTEVKDRFQETIQLAYDGNGKLATVSSVLPGTIAFERDAEGRIVKATRVRDNLPA